MGYAGFFLKALALALGGAYAEVNYLPAALSFLRDPASSSSALMKGFGLVVGIWTLIGLWVLILGLSVGGARKTYIEKAKKDGEKDVEERYALPNLYAQGTSKHAKAFNCVQRSHQQILECLPQVMMMALFSGVFYPVTTFATSALWWQARRVWSSGYAASAGNPGERYSHPLAKFIWTGYLALFFTTLLASAKLLGVVPPAIAF